MCYQWRWSIQKCCLEWSYIFSISFRAVKLITEMPAFWKAIVIHLCSKWTSLLQCFSTLGDKVHNQWSLICPFNWAGPGGSYGLTRFFSCHNHLLGPQTDPHITLPKIKYVWKNSSSSEPLLSPRIFNTKWPPLAPHLKKCVSESHGILQLFLIFNLMSFI